MSQGLWHHRRRRVHPSMVTGCWAGFICVVGIPRGCVVPGLVLLGLGMMPTALIPMSRRAVASHRSPSMLQQQMSQQQLQGCQGHGMDGHEAALLSFPGTYFILILYIRVFSLSHRSLRFGMSCRSLSPSSFTKGSLSTANVRCRFPRMNIQHFSNV